MHLFCRSSLQADRYAKRIQSLVPDASVNKRLSFDYGRGPGQNKPDCDYYLEIKNTGVKC